MAFLEVLAVVFYQLPYPQKWLVHFWNLPLANSPQSHPGFPTESISITFQPFLCYSCSAMVGYPESLWQCML